MPSTNVGRRSTFALAEMILSVAVLVILAGFSVLMFISAKNNNAKSYDMYKAMSHAINVVETIKALPHPGLLSEQDFDPKGAVLSRNGDAAAVCIYSTKHGLSYRLTAPGTALLLSSNELAPGVQPPQAQIQAQIQAHTRRMAPVPTISVWIAPVPYTRSTGKKRSFH